MITGQVTPKIRRYLIGLGGCALILALLLPLLISGRLDRVENRGLDWLQRNFKDTAPVSRDIVILYIDQKSIDFFQRARHIGWPWPRDSYALVVQYLHAAGARAVIFDAIFSEPSVFAGEYNDDQAFSSAMIESGRVFQTLLLHEKVKGGAPTDEERLAHLAGRGLNYEHQGGSAPLEYKDVTMPISPLEKPALGLGVINIRPDPDGVIRRLALIEGFRGRFYPTLSLAVFLALQSDQTVIRDRNGLRVGDTFIPLGGDGMALVKYYGGLGVYQDYTIAAVIQSAMNLQMEESPLVPLERFKDKIVFIGAKAASLYDLRSTPVAESLPGVEIHATFLNNLLAGDFLRQAPAAARGGLTALLLAATLSAAVLAGGVASGAVLSLAFTLLYMAGAIAAFRSGLALDLVTPVGGQILVFTMATLVNYYGEGREKRVVRNAFSRYLSPDVVATVLDNPEMLSLGGSRRVMTCFFSDLAGFTSISEALSPEDLVQLLNRYLNLMTRSVMEHGGTVDKFEGDAIMAFWGAPLIQDDHALRACLSALDQQALMAGFRRQALEEGLPELRVRMGLNTGPMIVGNMGSEERFDYTVMGDAVNLASRLEGANKQYGTYIMVSQATYEAVRDHVEVRELDLLRVKGKQEPITVYELMARAGELDEAVKRMRSDYMEGLAHYRDMAFEKAEEAFRRALAVDPDDGPARTYIERCRAYREDPPPPDWDRVFTMRTK